MDKLAVACGREFLLGIVARVLTDEPALFSGKGRGKRPHGGSPKTCTGRGRHYVPFTRLLPMGGQGDW